MIEYDADKRLDHSYTGQKFCGVITPPYLYFTYLLNLFTLIGADKPRSDDD